MVMFSKGYIWSSVEIKVNLCICSFIYKCGSDKSIVKDIHYQFTHFGPNPSTCKTCKNK